LKALSNITKATGVPLVADTTIIPFCAFNAKHFGVNIEVISSTKYISGGATSLGGLIIDYGTFDWKNAKKLAEVAKEHENSSFTFKLRKEIHRNLGAYMTAQTAHLQTIGLETLSLRFNQASKTCLVLATELEKLESIESVNYTGLPSNQYYEISTGQFGEYPGAMLTFDLKSRSECFSFLNKLKLIKRATNLFDNKSLAIHPESTIFGTFPEKEREKMDIKATTIRLSVGLENKENLLQDIKNSLK
jgi:O-acetylhomoserine (thiol)-lyase